jgi:hypothetical protein
VLLVERLQGSRFFLLSIGTAELCLDPILARGDFFDRMIWLFQSRSKMTDDSRRDSRAPTHDVTESGSTFGSDRTCMADRDKRIDVTFRRWIGRRKESGDKHSALKTD